jgi:hypothetical protein
VVGDGNQTIKMRQILCASDGDVIEMMWRLFKQFGCTYCTACAIIFVVISWVALTNSVVRF